MALLATTNPTAPPANMEHPVREIPSLWLTLKLTISNWIEDNAMRLSAALSLYTIISLGPLLVITFKLITMLWRDQQVVRHQIVTQVTSLMGAQAANAIQPMLDSATGAKNGIFATMVGTIVLFLSATCVFGELQDSMNTVWGVKPKPNQGLINFVRNRLLSMGMVFGIAFLLLVSMFVSALLTVLAKSFAGDAKGLAFAIDIFVSFAVQTLLFAAIFKFLPDVKLQWKYVWTGAILTAILFTIGKYGLALYFKYATPTSAFGAAGSLVAVLLWVYYSSFILFFGAEFTRAWAWNHGHRTEPLPNAVMANEEMPNKSGTCNDARVTIAVNSK
jgi:membrane protein